MTSHIRLLESQLNLFLDAIMDLALHHTKLQEVRQVLLEWTSSNNLDGLLKELRAIHSPNPVRDDERLLSIKYTTI